VVCFGEAAPDLAEAIRKAGAEVERVEGVSDAVTAAHRLAKAGDVVLLSPACTSYDAYDNFEQRGLAFREQVRRLAGEKP
jgi:UDP-N-acetylmuramoylalanine--D-glutamate ligase